MRCFIEKGQERMSEDEWGAVNLGCFLSIKSESEL